MNILLNCLPLVIQPVGRIIVKFPDLHSLRSLRPNKPAVKHRDSWGPRVVWHLCLCGSFPSYLMDMCWHRSSWSWLMPLSFLLHSLRVKISLSSVVTGHRNQLWVTEVEKQFIGRLLGCFWIQQPLPLCVHAFVLINLVFVLEFTCLFLREGGPILSHREWLVMSLSQPGCLLPPG